MGARARTREYSAYSRVPRISTARVWKAGRPPQPAAGLAGALALGVRFGRPKVPPTRALSLPRLAPRGGKRGAFTVAFACTLLTSLVAAICVARGAWAVLYVRSTPTGLESETIFVYVLLFVPDYYRAAEIELHGCPHVIPRDLAGGRTQARSSTLRVLISGRRVASRLNHIDGSDRRAADRPRHRDRAAAWCAAVQPSGSSGRRWRCPLLVECGGGPVECSGVSPHCPSK